MRISSVSLFGVLAIGVLSACSVSTTANSITFKTQQEFTDSSQPAKTSTADWNGEAIKIVNDGVNPLTGAGGIEITVDPSATKITASAVFAARADDDAHKSDADQSIADAIQTFTISEDNGFTVECHHGQAHGTSGQASSGCKLLRVTIPQGSDTKPVQLTVGNGIGDLKFVGSGVLTASKLDVQNTGVGDMDVKVQPTKGATLSVTGSDDITVRLPGDFASDSVTIEGGMDETDIDTSAFSGMKSGSAFGTTGTGAASLNIKTSGVGKIVVTTF